MSIREYQQGVMRYRPWAYWPLDTPSQLIPSVRLTAGNTNVQAPDSALTSTTGDIEVILRMTLDNWGTDNQIIFAKDNSSSRSFQCLNKQSTTGPRLFWWDSGAGIHNVDYGTSLSSVLTNGVYYWVKFSFDVDDGSGNRVFTVSYAADQETVPVSWTTLGTPVTTAGTTSTLDGTAIFTLGTSVFSAGMTGNIKYAEFHNVVGGSAQAVFNANITQNIATPNSWTDPSSTVVWTLSGATWPTSATNLSDISGNGRILTPRSDMSYVGGTSTSGARGIDSTNSGASAGSQTLNFPEVSIIAWIKWPVITATGRVLFSANTDNWSLQMWNDGNVYWDMGNNSTARVFAAWPSKWLNQWVLLVCSGSVARGRQGLWVNGETLIDATSTPTNPNSAFTFGVGQQGFDPTAWHFNGSISQMAVVTTELRRADARRLYNLALGRPC